MSKRFIGIDLEGAEVRVALLQKTAGKIKVDFERRVYSLPEESRAALTEMLAGKTAITDRLVTALPARVGLFRRLRFPFREKRKIEAALPLALSAQLPVSLEEKLVSYLAPRPCDNDYEVDAVVVNKLEVADLLEHFPDPEQHPGRIDIFPFALLPALAEQDGVLIYCRRVEVVVALIAAGKIEDYRLLPGTTELRDDELYDFISQQVSQLEYALEQDDLPLWVMGAGVTDQLSQYLEDSGRTILPLLPEVFGPDLSREMAPAAFLALAELRSNKSGQLNFRQGEFAARGQLEMMRPKLIVAALLLILVLFGGALTMHLNYLQKSAEEAELATQLNRIFRQVLPTGAIVDIPLQMEGLRQQLQADVQMLGLDGRGAVAVLRELSDAISTELRVELQEFNYSADETRISGSAESFDAVNQIAEVLGARPLFREVTITNARLATDNVRVDFEMRLAIAGRRS
ncbi:type II secretion system protein GspL [Pelovirga terrestris]|uniref:PilN domain-containing protein n=1 Tax=Pelovirga terrestris TaxID=2771352 RepID=A0A8J6R5N7_9BACT|nr:type II secretion system protein GspL [Pelovirga terrestris]MBD1400479.1 PilN domain-containing protein [Pelovirga terrestris]